MKLGAHVKHVSLPNSISVLYCIEYEIQKEYDRQKKSISSLFHLQCDTVAETNSKHNSGTYLAVAWNISAILADTGNGAQPTNVEIWPRDWERDCVELRRTWFIMADNEATGTITLHIKTSKTKETVVVEPTATIKEVLIRRYAG